MSDKSLIHHFGELRKRFLYVLFFWILFTFFSFSFYTQLISFFIRPFLDIQTTLPETLYLSNLFEGFFTKLKCCLIFGFILSLPFIIFQVFRFIVPGLKRKERLFILSLLIPSIILSFFAVYYMYTIVIPYTIPFLTSAFFVPKNTGIMLNFHDSIFYILQFLFMSVVLFQFPIIIILLLYFKFFTIKQLLLFSRYMFIIIFLISAILTPPDIISQISLAAPLIGMYFIALLIAKIFKLGKKNV